MMSALENDWFAQMRTLAEGRIRSRWSLALLRRFNP